MTRSMTTGLAGPILSMGNVHYLPAAKCGTFFARDNVSNFIAWCRWVIASFNCFMLLLVAAVDVNDESGSLFLSFCAGNAHRQRTCWCLRSMKSLSAVAFMLAFLKRFIPKYTPRAPCELHTFLSFHLYPLICPFINDCMYVKEEKKALLWWWWLIVYCPLICAPMHVYEWTIFHFHKWVRLSIEPQSTPTSPLLVNDNSEYNNLFLMAGAAATEVETAAL